MSDSGRGEYSAGDGMMKRGATKGGIVGGENIVLEMG